MRSPLVDITTINAVESLFIGRERDPWAAKLAGELADLFVYADSMRHPLPVPSYAIEDYPVEIPYILRALGARDSAVIKHIEYSTEKQRAISDDQLDCLFTHFSAWARSNKYTLERWLRLQNETWVRSLHLARVKHQYVFALENLRNNPKLKLLCSALNLEEEAICYAFDIVLRYPFYGELAGVGESYLHHPIRDAFSTPLMEHREVAQLGPSVRFRDSIAYLAPGLTTDSYTALLHELRGHVRECGLHRLAPGEVDREVVREIAIKVGLPPRLKDIGRVVGVGGGLLTGVGAIAVLAPSAAIVGGIISISSAIWRGHLPASVGKVEWLRWALEWDIEQQAEERK